MAARLKTGFVIGVDVGTASVRAGVFDLAGKMVGYSSHGISASRPSEHFVEQSSNEIWSAACASVRQAVRKARVRPPSVVGISFDATCSLVALDARDRPVTISPTGDPERNIIVWMDHRAIEQAERINALRHPALKYVGGRISPEMQPPKLLWIKEHLPKTWRRAAKFLDLADFMTYMSTGIDVRSLCTTVCKWTYLGHRDRWDRDFFRKVKLEELLWSVKIGADVAPMGTYAGNLTRNAADEFGLTTETKVAVGIIDAHAGGIGVFGMGRRRRLNGADFEQTLALIGGTSSCHMAVSHEPRFIKGVWGPYYSAMIPGMWLNEGGQSASGSLLDFIIRNNSIYPTITRNAAKEHLTVYEFLNNVLDDLKRSERKGPELAREINILPYFLGNRSPHADPTARGIISGVTLDVSVEAVAKLYYATIQAIAYGTRHIIEEMNRHGYKIARIHACGGGTKNPVWLQEHADVTGCEIILPKEPEAVILGSAMLAAVGAGKFSSVLEASRKMSGVGKIFRPNGKHKSFHDAKFRIFRKMYDDFKGYRNELAGFQTESR